VCRLLEVKVVNVPLAVALAAAGVAGCAAAVWRQRVLRRAFARERAAYRLKEGCLHRDVEAFRRRVEVLVARQAPAHGVLAEADLVLDEALAALGGRPYSTDSDDLEGGPA
jgi:hypothetical protein